MSLLIFSILLIIGTCLAISILIGICRWLRDRSTTRMSIIITRILLPFLSSLRSVLVVIIPLLISILLSDLKEPNIICNGGMLTKEKPYVEIKYDNTLGLVSAYWGKGKTTSPATEDGIKYSEPFEINESGIYYAQVRTFDKHGPSVGQYIRSIVESEVWLGEQDRTEGKLVQQLTTENNMDNLETTVISQRQSFIDIGLPGQLQSGWGDNQGGRESYTLDEINQGMLNNIITFNSISDSVIGNEKNFVAAAENSELGSGEIRHWFSNMINVEIGKEYLIRIYGHNNNPRGI